VADVLVVKSSEFHFITQQKIVGIQEVKYRVNTVDGIHPSGFPIPCSCASLVAPIFSISQGKARRGYRRHQTVGSRSSCVESALKKSIEKGILLALLLRTNNLISIVADNCEDDLSVSMSAERNRVSLYFMRVNGTILSAGSFWIGRAISRPALAMHHSGDLRY
jgi:hypothetical protein